jgi:hypothetical protein
MNLSITLNSEQQVAADSLLEDYNKNLKVKLTQKQYFEAIVSGLINERVEFLFKNSAQRLVDASKNLPYEVRIALIKEVEGKLS